jgi:hypothetical protein
MGTRYFALIVGIAFLLLGVFGLIPGLLIPPAVDQGVAIDILHGDVLGIFPANIVLTLIHLLVGVWGILAYRDYETSRGFATSIGFLFGVLFIMGIIPGMTTMFGMAPLYGANIWLHLAISLLGLYFGLVAPRASAVDHTIE